MTNRLPEALGGRPDSANYQEFREGFLALLVETDRRDPRSAPAKTRASGEDACAVTERYLQETFLGSYLRQPRSSPVYLHNASNLMTAIRYLEAQGSLQRFHGAYLGLLAWANFVEIPDPWILTRNCFGFLEDNSRSYDPDILARSNSARQHLGQIQDVLNRLDEVPPKILQLFQSLDSLADRHLRNAVAHSSYRVELNSERVVFSGRHEQRTLSFEDVDRLLGEADEYLRAFRHSVTDFAREVVPDCPYDLNWGPRY